MPTQTFIKLVQKEGHPAVRVFAEPESASTIIGEIPSDSHAVLLQKGPLFCQIEADEGLAQRIRGNKIPIPIGEKVRGWVGTKNVLTIAGTDLEFAEVVASASDVLHEAGGDTLFVFHIGCSCVTLCTMLEFQVCFRLMALLCWT